MSANLIKAVRKSLGNEALERRISELEARVAALEAAQQAKPKRDRHPKQKAA